LLNGLTDIFQVDFPLFHNALTYRFQVNYQLPPGFLDNASTHRFPVDHQLPASCKKGKCESGFLVDNMKSVETCMCILSYNILRLDIITRFIPVLSDGVIFYSLPLFSVTISFAVSIMLVSTP